LVVAEGGDEGGACRFPPKGGRWQEGMVVVRMNE
jgi:hypothetical protein